MQKLDSFFIVWDEWEIQQINSDWKKIEYFKFEKNYDLESVVCDNKNNRLLTIDEKTWNILEIEINNDFNIIKKYIISGYNLHKKWIEWFTQISENTYIISTQTKKNNLLILELKNNQFTVAKKINFKYTDLSWLDYYNGELYIISDKNDSIYKYSIETESIIETIDLKEWNWEWISINKNTWAIFLADDDGKIVSYK